MAPIKSLQTPSSDVKLDIESPKKAVTSIPVVHQPKAQSKMKVGIWIPNTKLKPKPIVGIDISPESGQRCFILKMLTILVLQLLATTIAIILTFTLKTGAREHMQKHQYGLWIAFGISIFILIVSLCFRNYFKKAPQNYILLLLFTCTLSYMMAAATAMTNSATIVFAGGFTLFVVFCIACSAWRAWRTNTELTWTRMIIIVLIATLLMLLIFGSIFRSRITNVGIGCVIAFVIGFCLALHLYLLIDAKLDEYSLDDYVIAVLDTYTNIVRWFLMVALCCCPRRRYNSGDYSGRGPPEADD